MGNCGFVLTLYNMRMSSGINIYNFSNKFFKNFRNVTFSCPYLELVLKMYQNEYKQASAWSSGS